MKFNIKDILLIAALIVSLVSIFISRNAYNISKKTYLLNLKPILLVDAVLQNGDRRYKLKFLNDGANSIYDIRIQSTFRVFDTIQMKDVLSTHVSKTIDPKYWKIIKEIKPNHIKDLIIDYELLDNSYRALNIAQKNSEHENALIPIHSFLIKYRREPDKKKYIIRKYIGLSKDNKDKLFAFDFDSLILPEYTQIKNHLINFDDEYKQ